MEKAFLALLFLTPVIGVYSGLSLAVTVPVFIFQCLFNLRKSLKFNLKNYIVETAFIMWILASSVWSLNPANSLFSALRFIGEVVPSLILIKNISKINFSRVKMEKALIWAVITAIIVFYGEYISGGKVSLLFRELTRKKESQIFFLHNLDRGVAVLTLLSWVMVGVFLTKKNSKAAIILYFAQLAVLFFSDSLAGMVAHIVGAGVFFLTRFTSLKNPKILCLLLITGSIFMIIFSMKINPWEIAYQNEVLPLSAKHRLFIWDFVADQAQERSLSGIGFNQSREFPVRNDQMIRLFGYYLSPLPLHPHNNIMQVYFELGMIGLFLYLALACKYILLIGKWYKNSATRSKDQTSILYSCFSVYFVIAMISYSQWQSWWVLTAVWIAALSKVLLLPPSR